jgi:hypothetical protein
MAALHETNRHAILVRYFGDRSMSEVGASLGAREDAAKKRVNRAVEKRLIVERNKLQLEDLRCLARLQLRGSLLAVDLGCPVWRIKPPAPGPLTSLRAVFAFRGHYLMRRK